uniref:Magnesium-transporting ATPase, P-type 1 n=1 Tax=Bionectria ochroleuca TaxID=29856 RepID=A0A0B7KSI2_BIOOC
MSFVLDPLKSRWASAHRGVPSVPTILRPHAPDRPQHGATPTVMSWQAAPESAVDSSHDGILRAFAYMPLESVLSHLQTGVNGISDAEAESRHHVKGPNVLSSQKPPSCVMLLLSVIPNPFNILLVFLAIINAAIPPPNWKGFAVLTIMVVISCAVRFWQEYRSGMAVFRLQAAITSSFKVRRQATSSKGLGKTPTVTEMDVPGRDLVPGDVVLLTPGVVVPADCLILESSFLRISQSTWTGESEPTPKMAIQGSEKNDTTLFDLANVAFMGTSVISGHGAGLVLRTGDDVLIASMAKELEKRRGVNAFQKGIRNVTWMLIGFMAVMVLCISGKTTGDWGNAALFSISVAVGLVPEMLPAIVNANLARGAYQLSKKRAIVKRLDSVQNLGAMSVLCSDKTGTLTKDEILVHHYLDGTGEENLDILKLATIDSSVQGSNGNNMDAAILDFRLPNGMPIHVAEYRKVMAIPFNFERRRSGCIVRGLTGTNILICKGAFDEVLALCSSMRVGGETVQLDETSRQVLSQRVHKLNTEGYRVLLIAMKPLAKIGLDDEDCLEGLESQMILEGMVSFVDPPKDDAAQSITQLKALGVEIKILTGDTLAVALNVCRSLELLGQDEASESETQSITGPNLAQLEGTDEFDQVVKSCKVFAKLTPSQKGMVVASLRKAGHCVGMLGDGINDCIALRGSDVGISVDSGAGVAKDCADLVLTEKGLGIIVDSVTVGRVTHGNTIKYIKMVASSNFGNVFSILAASAWLPFTPMTSLQILAQNLLYDISQIAIPWDRVDTEYLQQPRRWSSSDLLRFVIILGPTSSTIDICTFLFGWFFYGVQTASDTDSIKLFQTHWFLQGLLTQTLIVHLLRTANIPFLQSRAAPVLIISTVSIMTIGFILPWIPALRPAFSFAQPAPSFVGFLAAELLVYCLEVQLVKMVYIRIFGSWL